jgi:beta-1,4-mannosyltransferase
VASLCRDLSADTRQSSAEQAPPLAVVHVAPFMPVNPYQELLGKALLERGAETRPVRRLGLRHAFRTDRSREMIHLHWLEAITRSNSQSRLAGPYGLLASAYLLAILGIARLRGVRVVWTAHNLSPHESRRRWLDGPLAFAVARLASTVLVHSRHAADLATRQFRRADIEVAYHGNYLSHYPLGRSRAEARRALSVPQSAHVFIAFGMVRRYKQLPELISAFRSLNGDDLRLIVAGRPLRDDLRGEIEATAAGDPRVVLILEKIADERVVELHRAANVATLAYDDIFSSGALMLALSCGLPVIAPANSSATELAPPPVIQPYRPGLLAEAMGASRTDTSSAGVQAAATAHEYGWGQMADRVLGNST